MTKDNEKNGLDPSYVRKKFDNFVLYSKREIGKVVKGKFDSLNAALLKKINKLETLEKSIETKLQKFQKTQDEFWCNMDAFEETLLNLYHSITRNQYLYAFEPDEVKAHIPREYREKLDKKVIEKEIKGFIPKEWI